MHGPKTGFLIDGDDRPELAPAPAWSGVRTPAQQELKRVATPAARSIAQVSSLLKVTPAQCVKTLVVEGSGGNVVALVLRGDHELNAVKAQKLADIAAPLRMAANWDDPKALHLGPLPKFANGEGSTVFWTTGCALFKYGQNKEKVADASIASSAQR